MSSDDSIPWFRRVVPGTALIVTGFFLLQTIPIHNQVDVVQTVVRALVGLGLFVGGAVLVARPLAQVIATPFVRMLFPEDHDYRPPPLFSLARYYWRKGRHEEAIVQYRKILRYHPQQVAAYVELMHLLWSLDRRKEAEEIYRRGLWVFEQEADHKALEEAHARLEAGGAWTEFSEEPEKKREEEREP